MIMRITINSLNGQMVSLTIKYNFTLLSVMWLKTDELIIGGKDVTLPNL